jgi:hypothetical protein
MNTCSGNANGDRMPGGIYRDVHRLKDKATASGEIARRPLGFDMHRANLFMTNDGNGLLREAGFWPPRGQKRGE